MIQPTPDSLCRYIEDISTMISKSNKTENYTNREIRIEENNTTPQPFIRGIELEKKDMSKLPAY